MSKSNIDIYFLVFAAIFLFGIFLFFIIAFFAYYRKKQRRNFLEKEELKTQFRNELLQSRLEIQELTFNNISQEIHDNVGQILSLAKVQINIMNESDQMDRDMLNEVKENIGKAMNDLRDMARSLSSDRLGSLSIHAAVSCETERLNKTGIILAEVQVEGQERDMDQQKKLILFRIIQESLQNIVKHAQATAVDIGFRYLPEWLQVTIRDNGRGFDVEAALRKNTGLGLSNIKTRMALAGGSSAISSIPNEGTTVIIRMPYE